MTADEVRAAAEHLHELHGRFAPLFGTRPAQDHAMTYLRGLLLHEGPKNVEAIALHYGDGKVDALQKFVALSPWKHQEVMGEIQATFAETLVPTTAQWNLGTVGVIDESGFPKKGEHSVGVARQWCGRLGKKDNCQVGVFIVGVTPGGSALLDAQIYMPEEWILDRDRRGKAGVPNSVFFQTKQQIALREHARIEENGHVKFDWLTFDEAYGRDGDFLGQLERRCQKYVGEVPVTTTVWTEDPATQIPEYTGRGRRPTNPVKDCVQTVKEVAESLSQDQWKTLCLREGACEPVVFEFAAVRVWAMRDSKAGPPIWLMIRRPLNGGDDVKYFVSNAPECTPLEILATVSGCRVRVEECFQDGKTHLGMSNYEGRSWTGWHHHMALVALAHLFVTNVRLQLAPKTTPLNLDEAPKPTPVNPDDTSKVTPANLEDAPKATLLNLDEAPKATPQNLDSPLKATPLNLDDAPKTTPVNMDSSPKPNPLSLDDAPKATPLNLDDAPKATPLNLDEASKPNPLNPTNASKPNPLKPDEAPKARPLNRDDPPKPAHLSLDMALILLKAALAKPVMTLEQTIRLVEYYQRRNEVAKRSHRKRWERRNPSCTIQPLIQMFNPLCPC